VIARKPRGWFKASAWELDDAEEEDVNILINHSPKTFVVEEGVLKGMTFDKLHYDISEDGELSKGEVIEEVFLPCDDVILGLGVWSEEYYLGRRTRSPLCNFHP